MQITTTFSAPDRAAWRDWLAEHATTETEVWLVYYKKSASKPSVSYVDSLEEALCFGWVDSLIHKIDDEKYTRKFTPRKAGSKWSDVNQRLAAKLVREGHMTENGLARIDFPLPDEDAPRPRHPTPTLPNWLKTAFKGSTRAWGNFEKLPLSHQRRYVSWISDARREETRQKRIQEAIALLEGNKRLGIRPGEVRK